MTALIKDISWVRQSFLVLASDLERVDQQNRFFSTVSLKYTDTSPGGSIPINPPPQFTRYCDVKTRGRYAGTQGMRGEVGEGRQGMGRYYSEAIDDNAQVIHMRFGVAQFSSMTQFFTNFYNTGAGQLARTGRSESAFYYLGRAAGFVVSVMSWGLLAVSMLGTGVRFMLSNQSSKFYYLKPTMPLYWNAVTTMVNQLAVNRGIIPRIGGEDANRLDGNPQGTARAVKQIHGLLPEIFKENGGIDVYALANRAQRLARQHYKNMGDVFAGGAIYTPEELSTRIQQLNRETLRDTVPNLTGGTAENPDNTSYLGRWFNAQASQPSVNKGEQSFGSEVSVVENKKEDAGLFSFLEAEFDEGGAFASFRVDATGPVSESFSNTVGESELSSKFNSMSSSARSTSFSLSNGNVSDGAVGQIVGKVLGAAKDVATGAMDAFGISGMAALAGAAFVDIPKHWQSSQAQLPRANYTIKLVSPYGNPISQLTNIYIPLCMLLAGALPLSTGHQSYTSPFLLELYDKGRCQTRLGMIDSMQVSRGEGNLGFTNEGHALRVDVTFSVIDMSSIMHMPISQNFSLGTGTVVGAVGGGLLGSAAGLPGAAIGAAAGAAGGAAIDSAVKAFQGAFGDDTVFSDYMALLAGMGLNDQIYQYNKLKLNLTNVKANWDSFTSTSRFASFAGDILPGKMMGILYTGTTRDRVDLSALR